MDESDADAAARVAGVHLRTAKAAKAMPTRPPGKGSMKGKSKEAAHVCGQCRRRFAHASGLAQHQWWSARCLAQKAYADGRPWGVAQRHAERLVAKREAEWEHGKGTGVEPSAKGKKEKKQKEKKSKPKGKKRRRPVSSSPSPDVLRGPTRKPPPSSGSSSPEPMRKHRAHGSRVIHVHVL